MESLLTAFLGGALAEWGDRTQLLVVLLAARSKRPLAVLLALLVAAIVSNVVGAYAGHWIAQILDRRATTLLLALALVFSGVAGLIGRNPPDPGARGGFFIALILLLAAELGDRTQFLAFGITARFDAPVLATAGATAGIMAAALPAALLGAQFETLPNRALRLGAAGLFLVVGFVVGVTAL